MLNKESINRARESLNSIQSQGQNLPTSSVEYLWQFVRDVEEQMHFGQRQSDLQKAAEEGFNTAMGKKKEE